MHDIDAGSQGNHFGQEVQVPFLDVGATGATISPVKVFLEEFVYLGRIDSVDSITALNRIAQSFHTHPPMSDFMVFMTKRNRPHPCISVYGLFFIPSGFIGLILYFIFSDRGFFPGPSENTFYFHNFFIVVINSQDTAFNDSQKVPELWIFIIERSHILGVVLQGHCRAGTHIACMLGCINLFQNVFQVFRDLVIQNHLLDLHAELSIELARFFQFDGGHGKILANLCHFFLGDQANLIQALIPGHIYFLPGLRTENKLVDQDSADNYYPNGGTHQFQSSFEIAG